MYGFSIEASSDVKIDYFTLRDLAREVGVLKTRYIRSDPYRRDPETGLKFAQRLDDLVLSKGGFNP